MSKAFYSRITCRNRLKNERTTQKIIFFVPEPLNFEIFQNEQTGVIYISLAFHSHMSKLRKYVKKPSNQYESAE